MACVGPVPDLTAITNLNSTPSRVTQAKDVTIHMAHVIEKAGAGEKHSCNMWTTFLLSTSITDPPNNSLARIENPKLHELDSRALFPFEHHTGRFLHRTFHISIYSPFF